MEEKKNRENIDKLFGLANEMLDKADPTYRNARSYSLSEQVKMLMSREIPATDVTQWAIKLSNLAQELYCNTK